MKPKTLIGLAVVLGILLIAAFFLTREKHQERGASKMGDLYFSNLPVNEVAFVAIGSDDGLIHLKKSETVWQVEERNGYPADFGKIIDLVRKLSRMKIGRSFEATDEVLARQKLNDPQDANIPKDQKGLRITLKDAKDKVLADLIIGQPGETQESTGDQFIRPADSKKVSVVDDNFQFLGKTPKDWLKEDIVELDQKTIVQVAGFDGKSATPTFVLKREEPNKDPVLLNPPAGKTVDTQKVEQLFDAMSPLKIEDVSGPRKSADDSGKGPARPRLEYRLADGKIFHVYPSTEKESKDSSDVRQVEIAVAYEPPTTQPTAEKAAEKEKDSAKDGDKEAPKAPSPEEVKTRVSELNSQLGPWTFTLAKWQFDSFITRLDGLIQKKEAKPQNPDMGEDDQKLQIQ
jgi:hypothetical protein